MYVKRNIGARCCNHFCYGKVVSIKHYECVFVPLGTLHANRMCYIVICGLYGSKYIFSTLSHKRHDFRL
jgi:hypothetical protein